MPGPAIILQHCRCTDCLNCSEAGGEYFCSKYIGGTAVAWATGERVCDARPDEWHYCARYRGPQVSKDVWVWRRASGPQDEDRPAPGRGGPSSGPIEAGLDRGRDQPDSANCRRMNGSFQWRLAAATAHRWRQVGAGSTISANPADATASAGGRDVGGPGANGSFAGIYERRPRREQSETVFLFVHGENMAQVIRRKGHAS